MATNDGNKTWEWTDCFIMFYPFFLSDEISDILVPDIPLFSALSYFTRSRTVCQPIQPFSDQLNVRCPAFQARERLNSMQLTRAVPSDPIVDSNCNRGFPNPLLNHIFA